MSKLFDSKKGQIPVISDLVNAVTGFFQSLIQAAPGPARIIIFLLLLSIAALFVSFMIKLFGYHCDGSGNPMHLSVLSPSGLYNNIKLLTTTPDFEDLQKTTQSVSSGMAIPNIVNKECYLNNNNATFTTESGTVLDWSNKNAYSQGIVQCVTCTLGTYVTPGGFAGIGGTSTAACISDAYRIPDVNRTILQKTFCGWYVCEPTLNHYWKQSTNVYACTSSNCSGTTNAQAWTATLKASGAVYLYPTGHQFSVNSDGVFSMRCFNVITPEFTMYGIPIFNYRLWLFAVLLLIIIGFWLHFTKN